MLSVSVLGPVEVRRDGRLVPVPGGRSADLLVRLAVEAGTVVPADRLVDDLWGAAAVNTSRNTLQSKVVRLRKALGAPDAIVSSAGGYLLAVDPSDVDALEALALVSTTAAMLESGDDTAAAELCAATRQWFRDELLPGAGAWAEPHRARLEAARLHFIEAECTARLRLGQLGEVISDLDSATTEFPYQESLWALLITALYRSARQSDALRAYQRVRQRLGDELGLEPGPHLRQLEQQILLHEVTLHAGDTSVVSDVASAPIGNLPSMVAELVGRSVDQMTVGEMTATLPLVVIVGPGGIGKTALALAVARASDAPGGVWLVRFETVSSSDQVLDAVVAALGVIGGQSALLERLRADDLLLVFDNCEHVIDAAAALVNLILDEAPRTRILCTSQVALGLDGETVYEVEPLPLADAVELFAVRAATQGRSRAIESSSDALRDLCRALDGLPLAIELAAARTKTLSIAEITRRLDDRFEVLSDPTSRRPERRRALKATIGWSYDLLFPDDQRGLWALATFTDGASLPALEHVLEALDVPARTAIDVVSRLASRSLVLAEEAGDESRYRLLDSIRAFALDALAEAGVAHAAFGAHARWLTLIAQESTTGVRSAAQAEHLDVARRERANIDAALQWCAEHDPVRGVAIATGFGWAWIVLGDSRGALRILSALDTAGSRVGHRDRATSVLLAGWIEASTGELARARQHVEQAIAIADAAGDVEVQARGAYYLAYVASHEGRFLDALELTDRSSALYADIDHPWDVAENALFALRAATSAGDEFRAATRADEARFALAAVDDPWLHVRFEAMLGELARLQRRFDDAVAHLSLASETSRQRGYSQTEAYQLATLGRAQCQAGDTVRAVATLEMAIERAESIGDVRMAALARVHLGRVLRGMGDGGRAREELERAASWHRSVGGGEQALLGDCLLAALDAADGDASASERLERILDQATADDNAPAAVFALDALARLAVAAGEIDRARSMAASADAWMAAASHFITEHDRVDAVRE